MPLISRLIGLNLLVLFIGAAAMLGGKPGVYIDIPNIVFVLGIVVGGALMCFGFKTLRDAFSAALHAESGPPVSAWQRQMRVAVFARLYQLAWGGGLLSALLSLIAMLSDLSAPGSIGAGMAVALTGPVYGALLAEFVFNPMQQMVMNHRPTDDDPEGGQTDTPPGPVPTASNTALFKGVAVLAVIIAAFMVPIVSFSEIKKEDAFAPETEAQYIRYLYGDDAPQSQAVSPRLAESARQRALQRQAILERIGQRLPDRDENARQDILKIVMSIPLPEEIEPEQSHLWRAQLIDELYAIGDQAD